MIELAALLRLIPYVMVCIIAWQKGFKWLTLAAAWVSCTAMLNFFTTQSAQTRALLASVFAFLLLMHVLNLKSRK